METKTGATHRGAKREKTSSRRGKEEKGPYFVMVGSRVAISQDTAHQWKIADPIPRTVSRRDHTPCTRAGDTENEARPCSTRRPADGLPNSSPAKEKGVTKKGFYWTQKIVGPPCPDSEGEKNQYTGGAWMSEKRATLLQGNFPEGKEGIWSTGIRPGRARE